MLLTGDIVDAKTPTGGSEQNLQEWQQYQRVWRALADAAWLEPERVLDLRGNHVCVQDAKGCMQEYGFLTCNCSG
jgi:hypothetical protein